MASGHWITRRAEMAGASAGRCGRLACVRRLRGAGQRVRQAGLPHPGHRPHGSGAARRRRAGAPAGSGDLLCRQRAHQVRRLAAWAADWAPWWKARAAEGHEFASHTWDHVYWRGDIPGVPQGFRFQPSAGPQQGREVTWTAAQYCEQIDKAAHRLQEVTGKKPLPLFRAPGGKTSPQLLRAAQACGYAHVGWSPAGFLGDELPSETVSNTALLQQGAARCACRRHPGGAPGHLVAQGPLGAGGAGAADRRVEGKGLLLPDTARPSGVP